MTDEQRWAFDGLKHGWALPPPAAWPFRLPVIRHIRAMMVSMRVEQHYAAWQTLGLIRTGYDEWVLWAIARGKC